ncbi:hypothetical protein DAEQUDRAFT_734330 [Daedalea quercina L-15889]|uniref:CHAT domain-containing protein n=1 Tax=Daedalea quercina L-15889 TaxID=1314783 RepID=A0A165UDC0_9APHY|nr:hypothetical protein DAEQUDRAFT_734330 [Daedalea quercina L-15889]
MSAGTNDGIDTTVIGQGGETMLFLSGKQDQQHHCLCLKNSSNMHSLLSDLPSMTAITLHISVICPTYTLQVPVTLNRVGSEIKWKMEEVAGFVPDILGLKLDFSSLTNSLGSIHIPQNYWSGMSPIYEQVKLFNIHPVPTILISFELLSVYKNNTVVSRTVELQLLSNIELLASVALQCQAQYLEDNNIETLEGAIAAFEKVTMETPDGHPLQVDYLAIQAQLLLMHVTAMGEAALNDDIEKAVFLLQCSSMLSSDDGHRKPVMLNNLALALEKKYLRTKSVDDLKQGIAAARAALALVHDNDDIKAKSLHILAQLLAYQYNHTSERSDLEEAVIMFKNSLDIRPSQSILKWMESLQQNLEQSQFSETNGAGGLHIDEAITMLQTYIVSASESEPDLAEILLQLGTLCQERFESNGNLLDSDSAIEYLQRAILLITHNDILMSHCMNILGVTFLKRFEMQGTLDFLTQAIQCLESALSLSGSDTYQRSLSMANLAVGLRRRFETIRDHHDLELALQYQEQGLENMSEFSQESQQNIWMNYGNLLRLSHEETGDISKIDLAIAVQENALEYMQSGSIIACENYNSLGATYLARYEQSGLASDFDSAVQAFQKSTEHASINWPWKYRCLNSLALAYSIQYEITGDVQKLEAAIAVYENGANIPQGPDKAAILLNLAGSYKQLFQISGDIAHIEKAISNEELVLSLLSNSQNRQYLALQSLGLSLVRRFEHLKEKNDISYSIDIQLSAIGQCPDEHHTSMPSFLHNLSYTLRVRFKHYMDRHDLQRAMEYAEKALSLISTTDVRYIHILNNLGILLLHQADDAQGTNKKAITMRCISVLRETVSLTPPKDTCRFMHMNNLGNILWINFQQTKSLAHLDEAIEMQQAAVREAPMDHTSLPDFALNLGRSLQEKYHLDHSNESLNSAIATYKFGAQSKSGIPMSRFMCAVQWSLCLLKTGLSEACLEPVSVAFSVLPQVVWFGYSISRRMELLSTMGGFASEAAAIAIGLEKYELAVEWLEQGRSVLWGQLLQLRSPMVKLQEVNPQLAKQLHDKSRQLENLANQDAHMQDISSHSQKDIVAYVSKHHFQIAREWEILVDQARLSLDSEGFMKPKTFDQLSAAVTHGPFVILNVHQSQCDALILTPGSNTVLHVHLPELTNQSAKDMQHSLHKLVHINQNRSPRGAVMMSRDEHQKQNIRQILSELWNTVASPVLAILGYSTSERRQLPRLWWCPTGPLAFLPLHAAGFYGKASKGPRVSDFVVSSYIPSLQSLLKTQQAPLPVGDHMLTVGLTKTKGQTTLHNVSSELECIQTHALSGGHQHPTILQEDHATVAAVLDAMTKHNWVHFACHAYQNISEPTQTGFYLADGLLTIKTLITKAFPNADFAFLSACQTATGDIELSEEAMHLAAGLLFAGFNSVIASMWSVKDDDAPEIADKIYSTLLHDQRPDSSQAAYALHKAVKYLQGKLGTETDAAILSWAPFIHVGI